MKENNEKKIWNCDEISKLIKAFPKDIEIKVEKQQEILRDSGRLLLLNPTVLHLSTQ